MSSLYQSVRRQIFRQGRGFSSHTRRAEMSKVYAVSRGRSTGIFSSWDECRQQVHQYSGAVFKSFSTRAEAENFLRGDSQSPYEESSPAKAARSTFSYQRSTYSAPSNAGPSRLDYTQRSRDSRKRTQAENPSSSSSYSSNTITTAGCSTSSATGQTVVYTDGSCLGNGKGSARAGYGAFYGHNDPRNISSRLEGDRQSNQRAELTAVLQVLKQIDRSSETSVEIRSDSMYTINAATKWMRAYVNSDGSKKTYQNLDLMMDIYDSICDLNKDGVEVNFEYVAAHSGLEGNEMADCLAKQGALQR